MNDPGSRKSGTVGASATGLVKVCVPVATKDVGDHRARFRRLASRLRCYGEQMMCYAIAGDRAAGPAHAPARARQSISKAPTRQERVL